MSRSTDESTDALRRAAAIMNRYGDFIYRILRSQLNDQALVDDVFQDFYLSIVGCPIPEDIENMESYIYRAVSNNVLDAVRIKSRNKSNMKKYAEQLVQSQCSPPEQMLENSEHTNRTFSMLCKHLSTAEVQAVTLRFRDNKNTQETAQTMGINPRSVSRYMATGLKKIRCLVREQEL